MIPTEPRFLIIDLHKGQAVPATTEEMQALVWSEGLTGETYFEWRKGMGYDPETSATKHSVSSM